MMFINKKYQEEEPHTIVCNSLGQGKGRIETYYYGEAKAPAVAISDLSQLRVSKGASIDEILAHTTWRARFKKFINKLTQHDKS
jgi:hypothetical protein